MENIIKLTRDIEYHTIAAANADGYIDREYHNNLVAVLRLELTRTIRRNK